jgi:NCS1 family nucleobase:cation symporter-1
MVLLNVVTLKSYYTGPLAEQLNSVDISWIVGAVVTAVVYWLLTRNLDVAAEQAAIERSEAELRRIGSASGARAIAGRIFTPRHSGQKQEGFRSAL